VHDYKSLRAVAVICATMVNSQTHRQTHKQLLTDYHHRLLRQQLCR